MTFRCQPPAAVNQPCNVGPDAVQCAAGLVCSAPGFDDGRCVLLPGLACQADAGCQPGERCSEAHVCTKTVARGDLCGAGAPCELGHECFHSRCRKVVGAGETCPEDFAICGPGLACVAGPASTHGTCQTPPSAGQPRGVDARCADGLGCAFQALRARPVLAAGVRHRLALLRRCESRGEAMNAAELEAFIACLDLGGISKR